MQLIAGRTAQEFNKRKNRRGAFWEDRYHSVAVQTDVHLANCMTYIDLNMVRAHAVSTPGEWDVSGYSEICQPRQRKGVIDYSALCRLFDASSVSGLARWRQESVSKVLSSSDRQPAWTEAVGVGDETFLSSLRSALGAKGLHRHTSAIGQIQTLQEPCGAYFADLASKRPD